MRSIGKSIIFCLVVVLLFHQGSARIYTFDNKEYSRNDNEPLSITASIGMFSPQDAPISAPPGNGRSFADFQLNISGIDPAHNLSEAALLFVPYDKIDSILIPDIDTNEKHLCLSDGDFSFDGADLKDEFGFYEIIELPGTISTRFNISYSAMYVMYIVKCDMSEDLGLTVDGSIEFMNPFGHMKGEFYGILPFYAGLIAVMIAASFFWSIFLIAYRKECMMIQWMITGMAALTLIEFIFLFVDAVYENNVGNRSRVLEGFSVILTLGRKTASRVLVLIVCMGYGVAVPRLGSKLFWVFIYGGIYFSFGCLFEIAKQLFYDSGTASVTMVTLSSIPVAALDGGFYAWIFISLANTIKKLSDEQQNEKLKAYNRLKYTLIFYVVASIIWVGIELLFRLSGSFYTYWPMIWTFTCIWDLLFVIVFVVIMAYWRPSAHSHLYAYAQQLATTEDDMNNTEEDQFEL